MLLFLDIYSRKTVSSCTGGFRPWLVFLRGMLILVATNLVAIVQVIILRSILYSRHHDRSYTTRNPNILFESYSDTEKDQGYIHLASSRRSHLILRLVMVKYDVVMSAQQSTIRVRVIGNTGIGNTGKGIGDKGLVI
jgi:hypothetical protein